MRTAEAIRLGIHPVYLYRLRDEGILESLGRGIFRLASMPDFSEPDQWAQGKLWKEKFKALFWVNLRNVRQQDDYLSFLQRECGLSLFDFLIKQEKFLDQTLLILDSYEEPPKGGESLFNELKTKFKHIILTSRPLKVDFNHTNKYELLGFNTTQDIFDYMDRCFGKLFNPNSVNSATKILKDILSNNLKLLNLARVPLNLSLMCTICKDSPRLLHSFTSTTNLYIQTFNWLYKAYLLNIEASTLSEIRNLSDPRFHPQIKTIAEKLEEIAWEAVEKKQSYYSQASIEEKVDITQVRRIGIMRFEERDGVPIGYFTHLVFQEFLVAYRLASFYLESKRNPKGLDFVRAYRFKPHCRSIFWMTAGCLSTRQTDHPEALRTFLDDLFTDESGLTSNLIYELNLLTECGSECEDIHCISLQSRHS